VPNFSLRQELLTNIVEIKPEDLGTVPDPNQVDVAEDDEGEANVSENDCISEDGYSEYDSYDSEESYSGEYGERSEDEFDLSSIPPNMLRLLARTFASQLNPIAYAKAKAKASVTAKARPKARPEGRGQPKLAAKPKAKTKSISSSSGLSNKKQKR